MTISTKALDACAEYLLNPCFVYPFLRKQPFYEKLSEDKRLTPELKGAFELSLLKKKENFHKAVEALELPQDVKDFFYGYWFRSARTLWDSAESSLWWRKDFHTGSKKFDSAILKLRDLINEYFDLDCADSPERLAIAKKLEESTFRDNPNFYLKVLSRMEQDFYMYGYGELPALHDELLGDLRDPENKRWKTMRKDDEYAADLLSQAIFMMGFDHEGEDISMPMIARCFRALRHPEDDPLYRNSGKMFELFMLLVLWIGCQRMLVKEANGEEVPVVDAEYLRAQGVPEGLITEDLILAFALARRNPPAEALAMVKHKVAPKSGWPEIFIAFLNLLARHAEDYVGLAEESLKLEGKPFDEEKLEAVKSTFADRYEAFKAERRKRSYKKVTTFELFSRYVEAATMVTMSSVWGKGPTEADHGVLNRLGEALLVRDEGFESPYTDALTYYVAEYFQSATELLPVPTVDRAWAERKYLSIISSLEDISDIDDICLMAAWVAGNGPSKIESENKEFGHKYFGRRWRSERNPLTGLFGTVELTWPAAAPESFIPKMCDYMTWIASRPSAVAQNLKTWPEAAIDRARTMVRCHVGNLTEQSWENLRTHWRSVGDPMYPAFQALRHWDRWCSPRSFYYVESCSSDHRDNPIAGRLLQEAGMIDSYLSLLDGGSLWRHNADWLFDRSYELGRVMASKSAEIDEIGEVGVVLVENIGKERMLLTVGMGDEIARKTRQAKGKMPEYSEEWMVALPLAYWSLDPESKEVDEVLSALLDKAVSFLRSLEVNPEADAVSIGGVPHIQPETYHLRKLKNERKVKKPGKKGAVKVIPGEYDAPNVCLYALRMTELLPEGVEA